MEDDQDGDGTSATGMQVVEERCYVGLSADPGLPRGDENGGSSCRLSADPGLPRGDKNGGSRCSVAVIGLLQVRTVARARARCGASFGGEF
jgi:hypothetical protein